MLMGFLVITGVLFVIALVYPWFAYVLFFGFAFLIVIVMPSLIIPIYLSQRTGQKLSYKLFEWRTKYYRRKYLKDENDDRLLSILTLTVHATEPRTDRDNKPFDPVLTGERDSIIEALEEQANIDVLDTHIWQVDKYDWQTAGVQTNKTAQIFFLIGSNHELDPFEFVKDVAIASIDGLQTTFLSATIDGVTAPFYENIEEKEENLDIEQVDPGNVSDLIESLNETALEELEDVDNENVHEMIPDPDEDSGENNSESTENNTSRQNRNTDSDTDSKE